MTSIDERIQGGIYGLLAGDALGVPYEFHGAADIPPLDQIEMAPPAGFRRAHGSVPPGTWSDDGAQALALLASLLECGRLDVDDFGRRLVAWYERGYMAVDNRVFDVG
ncbi:MAG: ADP-ribosylglycohydrolase family protein, partial [Caldilinea sp.]|nr:ADP-ribosylglycohydrolase family protein [Caldilinea sp.]